MKATVHADQLGDLLDARAEIRRLKKVTADARAVWAEARNELKAAVAKQEGALNELEQRQGRLPFPDANQAAEPAPRERRAKAQEGTSDVSLADLVADAEKRAEERRREAEEDRPSRPRRSRAAMKNVHQEH